VGSLRPVRRARGLAGRRASPGRGQRGFPPSGPPSPPVLPRKRPRSAPSPRRGRWLPRSPPSEPRHRSDPEPERSPERGPGLSRTQTPRGRCGGRRAVPVAGPSPGSAEGIGGGRAADSPPVPLSLSSRRSETRTSDTGRHLHLATRRSSSYLAAGTAPVLPRWRTVRKTPSLKEMGFFWWGYWTSVSRLSCAGGHPAGPGARREPSPRKGLTLPPAGRLGLGCGAAATPSPPRKSNVWASRGRDIFSWHECRVVLWYLFRTGITWAQTNSSKAGSSRCAVPTTPRGSPETALSSDRWQSSLGPRLSTC